MTVSFFAKVSGKSLTTLNYKEMKVRKGGKEEARVREGQSDPDEEE
jgi:hypothetical protein